MIIIIVLSFIEGLLWARNFKILPLDPHIKFIVSKCICPVDIHFLFFSQKALQFFVGAGGGKKSFLFYSQDFDWNFRQKEALFSLNAWGKVLLWGEKVLRLKTMHTAWKKPQWPWSFLNPTVPESLWAFHICEPVYSPLVYLDGIFFFFCSKPKEFY